MDTKVLSDMSDEILKKRFYDCMLNSILPGKTTTPPSALLNGYIAEIVAINTGGPKLLRQQQYHQSFHRKYHKLSKELMGLHHFQEQFLLEDIPEEQPELSVTLGRCPDHEKEVLKYFCETCNEPICLDCTMTEHRKHRYCYLREVYHKQKHNVGSLLSQGKTQIENTRRALNEVKNMLSKVQDEKAALEKAIQENTQLLVATLRAREEKLLAELDTTYKQKDGSLRKEKRHLELVLERLSGSCQFTEKAIKVGNELEVLVLQKHLKRRLNEITNTRKDYRPTNYQSVHYFFEENAAEMTRKLLGDIIVSDTCPELSEAEGEGLMRAQVNSPAQFVVTTKGYDEQPRTLGGDCVSIEVRSPSKASVPSQVVDEGNGTYSVSYSPNMNGRHEVTVVVHKQPIKGSPFSVLVTNPRVYSKITRSTLWLGGLGDAKGKLKLPCGVAVDNEGRFLVADCHNHRIQIFDPQGKFMKSFGNLGEKNGQLNNPTDVVVDGEGNIIVCDKDNHRIQRFTKEGVFINKFGGFGEAPGKLKRPWGISIGHEGEIIVVDRRNNRVQIYKADGTFLRTFGCHGSSKGELSQPYHAAVNSKGDIFVTDSDNHRVEVFDRNGNYVCELGSDGNPHSQLKYPTGIAFDLEGHVIVADQYNHRLQVYNEDGSLEASLVSGLNGLGHKCYPKGVAVSPTGQVVVADSDNHRVIVL